MKKLALIVVCCLWMVGCAAWQSGCKSCQSDTMFLQRKVSFYNCQGDIIREWKGPVRLGNGEANYVDIKTPDGIKRLVLGGIYIVEEL